MSTTTIWHQTHAELRRHAAGADIALLNDGEYYTALNECADKCKPLVGSKWRFAGLVDGAREMQFKTTDMRAVLALLSKQHSVALMERVTHASGEFGARYTCVHVVPRQTGATCAKRPTVEDVW